LKKSKAIYKITKLFLNVYCAIGVHDWINKSETFNVTIPGRSVSIKVDRRYRICSNCLKCQHSGVGIMGNKWFNEDEKETNNRSIARSLKLKKLKNSM